MQMDEFEEKALGLMGDGGVWTTSAISDALRVSQLTANSGMNLLCEAGKIADASVCKGQKPKRYRIV